MRTGLYFGSFNPVHIGHLAIANYFAEFTDIIQVWFVISPQNPLKQKSTLLADFARYELLELAIGKEERFRISDIEFRLPKPSYTVNTLAHLKEKYPNNEFALIMGSDNLSSFHKWKNYEVIENNFTRLIYPRPGSETLKQEDHKNAMFVNAPMIDISSSFIRDAIAQGKDIRYFLPAGVYDHIKKMNYYR